MVYKASHDEPNRMVLEDPIKTDEVANYEYSWKSDKIPAIEAAIATDNRKMDIKKDGGGGSEINPAEVFIKQEFGSETVPANELATSVILKSFASTNHLAYMCTYCNERFKEELACVLHANVHTKKYDCMRCKYSTHLQEEIVSHINFHVQPNKFLTYGPQQFSNSVTCEVCKKQYANKSILGRHMRNHNKKLCNICQKLVVIKQMPDHIRMHNNEKPFTCSICYKSFSKSDHLKVHQRTHTGERPFPCSDCDKRFTTKHRLVIHQQLHTGEKRYKCEQCDMCFKDGYTRNLHVRIHTGERPFICTVCNKGFISRRSLNRHMSSRMSHLDLVS